MNETYVTIAGNIVAEPDRRVTTNGAPFTALRVASTIRRRTRDGEFVDGPTSYYQVTAFRSLALNAANSLSKGDPVIVHGRQRVNQWQRNDGTWGTSVEIDASNIGHDLTRGTSEFTRQTKAQMDASDRLGDPAVQAAHDEQQTRHEAEVGASAGDPSTDRYEVTEEGSGGGSNGVAPDGGASATAADEVTDGEPGRSGEDALAAPRS